MYSQNDLDDAVASGAITPESAASLRAFVDRQRSSPAVVIPHEWPTEVFSPPAATCT